MHMTVANSQAKQKLQTLPAPLKNISATSLGTIKDFAHLTNDSISTARTESKQKDDEGLVEIEIFNIGALKVVSGKTTPLDAELEVNHNIAFDICYEGRITYKDGTSEIQARKGEMVAIPNEGGIFSTSYYSGLAIELDRQQLARTMRAISTDAKVELINYPWSTASTDLTSDRRCGSSIIALFDYIDILLKECRKFPSVMGLDDQVYRAVALEYLKGDQKSIDKLRDQKYSTVITRNVILDNLIDYIKARTDKVVTLTDLQEQSRYSSRHLQTLFKEKFNCTPMQFVRRQRLSDAMEKLQTANNGETVTSIARECGYRFTSYFTTDFHREFNANPSAVLRASRGANTRL
jgi:AraC-like DNA-binding protein